MYETIGAVSSTVNGLRWSRRKVAPKTDIRKRKADYEEVLKA